MAEPLRFRCRGHENLRATHSKTLELTRESEISRRGTCIVGVGATYEPRQAAGLRGTLKVTLRLADAVEEFEATANPFMAVSDSLVFRRSDRRTGNTFALRAEKTARDLDRGWIAMLTDPGTELEVTIEETMSPPPPGALLLLLEEPEEALSPKASRFLEAADAAAAATARPPLALARGLGPEARYLPCRSREEGSRILRRLASGDRVVLAIRLGDLKAGAPPLEVIREAADSGLPLTTVGAAPPGLRALAMSGVPALPFALRDEAAAASWREDLASPALRRGSLVLPCAGSHVPARLDLLAEAGESRVFLVRDPGGGREEAWWGAPAQLADRRRSRRRTREPWFIVAGPREGLGGGEEGALPRGHLLRLLESGIPLKTLARATRTDFGGSYRAAYRFLLALKTSADDGPGPGEPGEP